MRRILITGIAGFIGSNLAERLLNEGYYVVGIDNLSQGVIEQVPPGVEFHELDIRSDDIHPFFWKIDTVFHLAAKNCISDCQKDPIETVSNNVLGQVNVFEAASLAGVRKVIYAESSAMYEGTTTFPIKETQEQPQSFYALSKSAGRLFAKGYQQYRGLKMTALRYFNVYGPKQDYRRTIPPLMSSFIIKLLKGERPTIYGSGDKRRDFVYIDDVNDFHLRCLIDPYTDNRTFNVGSGTNHSVKEIFDIIKQQLHSNIEPIYEQDLPGEAAITLADTWEAYRVGGWKASIGIEEGIERSIAYIRKLNL